jgi:pyrimidine deaminase RibD-like protein
MDSISNMTPSELDEHFLRRSFEVARRALTHGNHPFGAILVDQNRNVLIEAENGCMPAHDGTAHAERLLATQACTTLSPDILKSATLYSSARMLFSPPSSKFTTNCTATRASPGQRGSGGLRP